jgi:hypothetical protein
MGTDADKSGSQAPVTFPGDLGMEAKPLENAVHHLLGASTRHPDQREGAAGVGAHRGAIGFIVRGPEEVGGVDAERAAQCRKVARIWFDPGPSSP